ncbi:60S acidic ribosomal protein P0-like [Cynara cardunculus var. scolymus]|uniref:60S acidic ribosomal protein P0-like n=1 Tax=Cynara cardunculus var. scolymus TaxID=59895 RepID=UPI000D623D4D|nr:60S acidic ribosomal protein P0-like [Cynara cardunculus var. scolymus]
MGKVSKADKKIAYDQKLCQLLDDYMQILVATADNVGSNQLQNIRHGLRGDSVILMGKNTMMKRSVRMHSEKTGNKAFLNLIPLLVSERPFRGYNYLIRVLAREHESGEIPMCSWIVYGGENREGIKQYWIL